MALFILFSLLIILFGIVALFSFPRFSPIPYFPTDKHDLDKIVKALGLKNNQTVFDLGAGDGIVIFEAAKEAFRKKLNTQFIAVEINPVLLCVLNIRRFFHPNKKNIKIVRGDIFKINFMNFINLTNFITFYLYISPWHLETVIRNLKLKIKNFSVVSYMYPIRSLKKSAETTIRGKNNIYQYNKTPYMDESRIVLATDL